MSPFEIRAELLKLAFEILKAQSAKPEQMPTTDQILVEAEKLNEFVSRKG